MRLPSVPGPSDVLAAVGGLRDGVGEALALVPRVATVVGRVEQLVDRMAAILDRVEGIADRADATIGAVAQTQAKADDAIERVGATQAKADETIGTVDGTVQRAAGVLGTTEGLVGRTSSILDDYEPALLALGPAVRRLAATLSPAEVEAFVTLVDPMPQLVIHLDEDILPLVGRVGVDVHDLLDTVQDMRQVVKGFPGSRLFRRRGAEEIADEEAREAATEQA
jgi:ABC-type transporter Mla subunit MlaD